VNTFDHQLDRLFKAASRAPGGGPHAIPVALEGRALALWADRVAVDNGLFWVLPMLRHALAVACAFALAAVLFHCSETAQPAADEAAIINCPISLSYLP
jgi:hypothetical protein